MQLTLTLTDEQAIHVHACLTQCKNDATRSGATWSPHQTNASVRSAIENALTIARLQEMN